MTPENSPDDAMTSPETPKADLPTPDEDLVAVIGEVEKQLDRIKLSHQEQEALRLTLLEREQDLARRLQEAETRERELAQARTRCEETERSLADRERAAAEAQERLEAERTQLEETRRGLEQQREASERESADRVAEVERREAELQQQRDELERAARALTEEKQAVETLANDLSSREAEATRKVEEARGLHEEAQALRARFESLEHAKREAEEARQEAERRAETSSGELTSVRDALADRESKLEQATAKLREVSAALTEHAELAGQAHAALEALDRKEKELAQTKTELEQARAQAKESSGADERTRAELEGLRAQVASVTNERDELKKKAETLAKAVEELRSEADELRDRAKAAETAAATRAHADGGTNALRRERLRRARRLVREETEKLRKAHAALRERTAECEEILGMREKLEAAARELQLRERALRGKGKQKGSASAMASVFYAALASAILAGASWLISGEVAPATYEARAALEADGRGAELSPAQLGEWQRLTEEMLNDPATLEVAADRMKQRGLTMLATPGALRQVILQRMGAESPQDGRLILTMRAEGEGRAERVLDTYVTALANHANSLRQHRADGAATAVAQAAEATPDPVDDERVLYAGGIFGGSFLVCLLIGMLVTRQLAQTMRAAQTPVDPDFAGA